MIARPRRRAALLAAALALGALAPGCSRDDAPPRAAAPPAPAPAAPPAPPAAPALAPAKAWALATSAILTERNRHRHDLLAGAQPGEETAQEMKEILSEFWGVNGREDLLRTLQALDDGGHRQGFERLGAQLERTSDEQIKALLASQGYPDELAHRIEVVTRWYRPLGSKGLLGWDYARYVSLCRWGYAAGYLGEAEAWARILPVARKLQRAFASWRELGDNYLIGRQFWSLQQTRDNGRLYVEVYEKLVADPQSPWNRHAWATSLEDG